MRIKTKHRLIKPNFKLAETPLYKKIAAIEPKSARNTIPIAWAKAKDFSVWDEYGNKFIDLTSGIFVANAGHSNPQIKKAINKQMDSDMFFSYNYPTIIKKKFEYKLLSLSPKYFNTVALLNSGTEAMNLVYKLIKLHGSKSKKKYIITFKGSYHGRGLGNDLISGNKEKATWAGVTDETIVFIDFPYEDRTLFDPKKLPPAKEIAGFIVETFQGWGAWFYPKKFIKELVYFAQKNNALVAFDEMQAGFYRMGPLYGYMTYGNIKPDILALGKGISSSLPLAAVLSRREYFDIDKKADLYGTQSGNAVCVASGLANLKFLSSTKETSRRKKNIPLFEKELKSLQKFRLITRVNVRGLIAGIIFEKTEDATAVVHGCIMRGVLPVCTNRNSIKIGPPLTITPDAILEAVEVIRNVISDREKSSF